MSQDQESYVFKIATSYAGLEPITQAYGVCLNEKNEVLLQKHPNRPWNIPGGKPEPGETYEEALIREVYEETNVRVDQPRLFGYQEVWVEGKIKCYQLRYIARVTAIDERQPDPDEGVMRERMFVPLNEATKHIPYPQYAEIFKAVADSIQA